MGMGEPLANLPNLLPALDLLISPSNLGMGARHVTISTSGLAPQIEEQDYAG
jgi:23S rRNA (adenine2503-C2)-methyltransferase